MKRNSIYLKSGLTIALVVLGVFGLDAQTPATSPIESTQVLTNQEVANTNIVVGAARIPEHKRGEDIIKVGSDVVLKKDEVSHDVVVVRGSATIDGTVDGDLVVVAGLANVNGKVNGDMVVVLGSANLAAGAEIANDATVVGGALNADPAAKIGGGRVEVDTSNVPGLKQAIDWCRHGLLLARPLPPQVGWVRLLALAFLLINVLCVLMFQRPILAIIKQMEKRPIASFFSGLLLLILIGPLLILLVPTLLGAPLVLLVLLVGFIFGKLAVYCHTGRQLLQPISASLVQSLLFTLITGTIIFYLMYIVPVIGFLAWGVAGVWGLGGAMLALFGSFRQEKEATTPVAGAAEGGVVTTLPITETESSPPTIPAEVSLPRVGFWLRLVASLLDLLLIGTISTWLNLPNLFLILWGIYHVTMWTWKGATIGGIVTGIKIIRVDGQPLGFAVALIRCLSGMFSAMALFVGFFWAGWSREKQSWHDKIAGTIVIKVPKGMSLV